MKNSLNSRLAQNTLIHKMCLSQHYKGFLKISHFNISHRIYKHSILHFCLQYPLWEKQYNELSDFTKISDLKKNSQTNKITDYTAETVEKRLYYRERMDMVNKAANDADIELASYIFKAVTQGLSYEDLRLQGTGE